MVDRPEPHFSSEDRGQGWRFYWSMEQYVLVFRHVSAIETEHGTNVASQNSDVSLQTIQSDAHVST